MPYLSRTSRPTLRVAAVAVTVAVAAAAPYPSNGKRAVIFEAPLRKVIQPLKCARQHVEPYAINMS